MLSWLLLSCPRPASSHTYTPPPPLLSVRLAKLQRQLYGGQPGPLSVIDGHCHGLLFCTSAKSVPHSLESLLIEEVKGGEKLLQHKVRSLFNMSQAQLETQIQRKRTELVSTKDQVHLESKA